MNNSVEIREFHDFDVPEIEKLFIKAVLSICPSYIKLLAMIINLDPIYFSLIFYYYIYKCNPRKRIDKYHNGINKIWILKNQQSLIGFVSLEPLSNEHAWVTYMFVDPQYHRQGYGAQLTEILFKYGYKKLGYKHI